MLRPDLAAGFSRAVSNAGTAASSHGFELTEALIEDAFRERASDIHLEPQSVMFLAAGPTGSGKTTTLYSFRECRSLGFVGRLGLFEMWRLEDSDYDLILSHSHERDLRRHLAERGFVNLVDDGLNKVTDGRTTVSELRRAAAGRSDAR